VSAVVWDLAVKAATMLSNRVIFFYSFEESPKEHAFPIPSFILLLDVPILEENGNGRTTRGDD
jgi:hypothetical protein